MKLKILMLAMRLSFLAIICFPAANAIANAWLDYQTFDAAGNPLLSYFVLNDQDVDTLNKNYFDNGIMHYPAENPGTDYVYLPGYTKRYGVFKLQKGSKEEDLILASKAAAMGLCKDMVKFLGNHFQLYGDTTVFVSHPFQSIEQSIAVAYWIAYDGDSTETADGGSTRMQKHIICPNPFGETLKPSNDLDENELEGIQKVDLKTVNGLQHYFIVCMNDKMNDKTEPIDFVSDPSGYVWTWTKEDGTKKVYRISTVDKRLHQINKQVGGKYCSGQ